MDVSGTLKQILRNISNPDALDAHPWTQSLIVQETLIESPELGRSRPGEQLVAALARLFQELQPDIPPRCGKRLDSRWGEFGLLAALYFTPFNHGTPYPATLTDAWKRIDSAILYFVYGKPADNLADDQIKKYQLVGADIEYGPASTLSDWHKKGLQRFTEIILNRERFLSRTSEQPSIILEGERAGILETPKTHERHYSKKLGRTLWLAFGLSLLTALAFGSLKAWKIYEHARLVYEDMIHVRELVEGHFDIETIDTIVPGLEKLQEDLSRFKTEAQPVLSVSPWLGWVPVYGTDLKFTPALIEMAEHLLNASLIASHAAQPLLDEFESQNSNLVPEDLTALIIQAQPDLREASGELDRAIAVQETIEVDSLSPRFRGLLEELEPVLKLADQSLSVTAALPGILGADKEGPKTYLIVAQNEDELRPTGGFITSVGNLVIYNGQVISVGFESVDTEQEDWSKPYPSAPWQLKDYMNSRVLVLRDANWFTDFPTAVLWMEYLYAYTHAHSVDGIIAFDQHFLVMLLGEIGPLQLDGTPYPITDRNVIEYMRQAKIRPAGESAATGWYRKAFINELAGAILEKLIDGQSHDWRGIAQVLLQSLTERHLLLQFDDPTITALITDRGWDNAIHVGEGDFLMVADTNVGFNKTNAVVEISLTYDIDLNDLSTPTGLLTVTHRNNSTSDVPCSQWNSRRSASDEAYPINRCYWNYLRVYKQKGVELSEATPHFIPGRWMLLGLDIPPRVDDLDEEIPGVRGFGTLLVVPGGKSLSTSFQFFLPGVVQAASDDASQSIYRLKIQKQPGTLAIPVTIRIHLPAGAVLQSRSLPLIQQDQHLLVHTNLRTDVNFEIRFANP